MMYRLTKHRRGNESVPRFAIFPSQDANFAEIQNQFGYTALYVFIQILNLLSRNALGTSKRSFSCPVHLV
jgi:hypothetical protein